MNITSAKYNKQFGTDNNESISAIIDGEYWSVPLSPDNRFYIEIMRQVEAGELTIAPADEEE